MEIPSFYLKFGSTLLLIIRIIQDKNKNGWHYSRRHVIDPTLKLQEILQRQLRKKTWHIHPQNIELLALKEMKLVDFLYSYKCSYLRKTSVKDKKTVCLRNKKVHNLETLECILEKTTMLLKTSWLKNCGDFLIYHPKNWGSLTKT